MTTAPHAQFPPSFLWGAATAAYQIEGAVDVDGRTPSIWDTWSHTPGAVAGGDTGDVACDHYHRMPADVALLKDLAVGSYRFSIAWPRVRPDGGAANPRGLAFYDRLVDELLAAGIMPWVSLYHWDLPQALEDAGGWTSRDTAHRFADYAVSAYEALGDRVGVWTTMNEPWCSAFLGHTSGEHAPGRQAGGAAGLVAAHHLMLGHGLAVRALRDLGSRSDLGITLNFTVADPRDPGSAADVDAARRIDALHNRAFLDPLLRGSYPPDLLADTATMRWQDRPWTDAVREGDLAAIAAPLDLLGVNYYQGDSVSGGHAPSEARRPGPGGALLSSPFPGCGDVVFHDRGLPRTGMGWDVQPEGLTRLLCRLAQEYAVPPLYVTENGAAYDDPEPAGGRVADEPRRAFLEAHLRAVHDALDAGVDVRGFFAWSLLDNFEWAHGYARRFGIVHVDYDTQVRTPKDSALWYADVARTGLVPARPELP